MVFLEVATSRPTTINFEAMLIRVRPHALRAVQSSMGVRIRHRQVVRTVVPVGHRIVIELLQQRVRLGNEVVVSDAVLEHHCSIDLLCELDELCLTSSQDFIQIEVHLFECIEHWKLSFEQASV